MKTPDVSIVGERVRCIRWMTPEEAALRAIYGDGQ